MAKLSITAKKRIVALRKDEDTFYSMAAIKDIINSEFDLDISESAVQQFLKKNGDDERFQPPEDGEKTKRAAVQIGSSLPSTKEKKGSVNTFNRSASDDRKGEDMF